MTDQKLPVLGWKEVLGALGRAGFRPVRQRGSQSYSRVPQGKYTVVPRHDEIAPSTLMKILAEADLTKEEFLGAPVGRQFKKIASFQKRQEVPFCEEI